MFTSTTYTYIQPYIHTHIYIDIHIDIHIRTQTYSHFFFV